MGKRRATHSGAALSVRSTRLNAGLTIDELAVRARLATNTIRRLEAGYRSTALDHAAERRVAATLSVPVEAITFGTDDDEPTLDLADERKRRNLTHAKVAEATGVPVRSVRRIEAGASIGPRYALRLADFYGCRVSDFYPRERRAAAA